MLNIPNYIRVVQTRFQEDEYTLFNSITGDEYVINQEMYNILRDLSVIRELDIDNCKKIISNYSSDVEEIIEMLYSEKILSEETFNNKTENILEKNILNYPLTSLIIELTNICSLKCIHCYGVFGENKNKSEFTYKDIIELKQELDCLHVQSIVLTGGDILLNENLENIVLYLLENGFKVTLLLNGWNDISHICSKLCNYHFSVVFSVDGPEEVHDEIRGVKGSFSRVMESIEKIKRYTNVSIGVSTTVMKSNLKIIEHYIEDFSQNLPEISINTGLIIPVYGCNQSFGLGELEDVYNKYPKVLRKFVKENVRKERCQGGISIASLSSEGNLSICAAARDEEYVFGNIHKTKLLDLWASPPNKIKQMRQEMHLSRSVCMECDKKNKCIYIQDCRIYAKSYTGNMDNPSPICCLLGSII